MAKFYGRASRESKRIVPLDIQMCITKSILSAAVAAARQEVGPAKRWPRTNYNEATDPGKI